MTASKALPIVSHSKEVDLHIHTTASDGTVSPAAIVALAESIGLIAVAITDHDTVAGLAEGLTAARTVEVVSGIEISVQTEEGSIHVVGLWLNHTDPLLLNRLDELLNSRLKRNTQIVARLGDLGMPLTMEEVAAVAGGTVIGRPHFAEVLRRHGYVSSSEQAFNTFLNRGKPAYVERMRLSPPEAFSLFHQVGGIAVLAHPGHIQSTLEQLEHMLHRWKDQGLDGVEVYHPDHSPEQVALFRQIARRVGLAESGGSDFHGLNRTAIRLGAAHAPADILSDLRARRPR
jgi:predicted metal-dependent phosphoesterase TrpH